MTKSILRSLLVLTVALCPLILRALETDAPADGNVYRFINVNKGTSLTALAPYDNVVVRPTDETDPAQQWLLSDAGNGKFAMRSLLNGMYLSSSQRASGPWSYSSTAAPMEFSTRDGNYIIRASGDWSPYGYMHADNSNIIVCWETSNPNTQWVLSRVEKSQSELADIFSKLDELAASSDVEASAGVALNTFFEDKACTTLKSEYLAMSDEALAALDAYKELPEPLQLMIGKIRSGDWSEAAADGTQTWDSGHAQKFRVQMYEPYSDAADGANAAGIQAWSAMNNPTGIVTGRGEVIYVMVDKMPGDGATLTLGGLSGIDFTTDNRLGVELHEGLNVIPTYATGSLQYIFYTVNTYDNDSRTFRHRLSEFEPIKIHIEGGTLNGFFNYKGDSLYAPDTDSDWAYYRTRAFHDAFDLVGDKILMHFSMVPQYDNAQGTGAKVGGLRDILDPDRRTFNLPDIIGAWDDFIFSERLLMGILSDEDIASPRAQGLYESIANDDIAPASLSEYLNTKMLAVTAPGSPYMHASWGYTAYKPSTISDILLNLPKSSGALWGPAHEYGHTCQGPIKITGTTEISNNLFSNAAVYCQGLSTSRTDFISTQLNCFNEGRPFLENGIWGTTRMYFQLWCYYHVLGNNRKFYPRLFQLLRENPLVRGSQVNNRYDMLQFAKMACIAAQEDLTDYFESWGFFVLQDNYRVDDYSVSYTTLTEADLKAWKAEIAALNLPKNRAVMFVDDRVGSERSSFSSEWPKDKAGDMGGFADFRSSSRSDGNYIFEPEGNSISVSAGTGGVGFLVLDNEGRLLSFSNSRTFEVTNKALLALFDGSAKLYAVDFDSKTGEAPMNWDDISARARIVESLVARADAILTYADDKGTKVGYYRAEATAELSTLRGILAAYTDFSDGERLRNDCAALLAEIISLEENPEAIVGITDGSSYNLVNVKFGQALSADTENALKATSEPGAESQKWIFESAGEPQKYYLRNAVYGYLQAAPSQSQPFPMGTEAVSFTLLDKGRGVFALSANGNTDLSLNINSGNPKILAWHPNEDASQWRITLADDDSGLEDVIAGAESGDGKKVIFDISGRRIHRITAPGLYIINGRKCIITSAQL